MKEVYIVYRENGKYESLWHKDCMRNSLINIAPRAIGLSAMGVDVVAIFDEKQKIIYRRAETANE